MAFHYDERTGFHYDDEADVFISPDGAVHDAEDGTYVSTVDEFYEFGEVGDLADDSDATFGMSELTPQDIAAISEAVGENYRARIGELQEQIAAFREQQAVNEGYECAHDELAAAEDDALAAEDDFAESMVNLADKLGRTISSTEPELIRAQLPEAYSDNDVAVVAGRLGIRSFTDDGDNRNGGARGARERFINMRAQEMEDDDRSFDGEGWSEPDVDTGGMAGQMMEDDRLTRLVQSAGEPEEAYRSKGNPQFTKVNG